MENLTRLGLALNGICCPSLFTSGDKEENQFGKYLSDQGFCIIKGKLVFKSVADVTALKMVFA